MAESSLLASQPLVSIITVVYNDALGLAHTLEQIALQTYPHIEHVVVDGASTDGTTQLVTQAAQHGRIHTWLSEPDAGLYDAMNKGLKLAKGDYVWFINAGDAPYESNTLEAALASASADADVLYGDCMLVDEAGNELGLRSHKQLPKQLTKQSMQQGMVVSHQSLLVKRSLAPAYDLRYRIAGDIDWTIRVLEQAKVVVNTGLILSRFLVGGTSAKRRRASWGERFRLLRKHFGLLPTLWVHAGFVVKQLLPSAHKPPTKR